MVYNRTQSVISYDRTGKGSVNFFLGGMVAIFKEKIIASSYYKILKDSKLFTYCLYGSNLGTPSIVNYNK